MPEALTIFFWNDFACTWFKICEFIE